MSLQTSNNVYSNGKQKFKYTKRRKETTQERHLFWNEYYSHKHFGLWIECTKCKKWRKCFQYVESHEVPGDWHCSMNIVDNKNKFSCEDPEEVDQEDYLEYCPGSIVWAKLDGYPWWPGMVDEDPDIEEYFWKTEEQTFYNVTFLDENVSRAWILSSQICHFLSFPRKLQKFPKLLNKKKYSTLLKKAEERAQEALKFTIKERLQSFSFAHLYKGKFPHAHFETENTEDITADALLKEISDLDFINLLDSDNEDDSYEKQPRENERENINTLAKTKTKHEMNDKIIEDEETLILGTTDNKNNISESSQNTLSLDVMPRNVFIDNEKNTATHTEAQNLSTKSSQSIENHKKAGQPKKRKLKQLDSNSDEKMTKSCNDTLNEVKESQKVDLLPNENNNINQNKSLKKKIKKPKTIQNNFEEKSINNSIDQKVTCNQNSKEFDKSDFNQTKQRASIETTTLSSKPQKSTKSFKTNTEINLPEITDKETSDNGLVKNKNELTTTTNSKTLQSIDKEKISLNGINKQEKKNTKNPLKTFKKLNSIVKPSFKTFQLPLKEANVCAFVNNTLKNKTEEKHNVLKSAINGGLGIKPKNSSNMIQDSVVNRNETLPDNLCKEKSESEINGQIRETKNEKSHLAISTKKAKSIKDTNIPKRKEAGETISDTNDSPKIMSELNNPFVNSKSVMKVLTRDSKSTIFMQNFNQKDIEKDNECFKENLSANNVEQMFSGVNRNNNKFEIVTMDESNNISSNGNELASKEEECFIVSVSDEDL